MRYAVQLGVLLLAAILFSVIMTPVMNATMLDAYLDFLDQATVAKISDYSKATQFSRTVGLTLLLMFWSAVVWAILKIGGQNTNPANRT